MYDFLTAKGAKQKKRKVRKETTLMIFASFAVIFFICDDPSDIPLFLEKRHL